MEIFRETNKVILVSLFFVLLGACKNTAQNKTEKNEVIKELPKELADKKWIPYYKDGNTYKELKEIIEFPVTKYVKTSKTSFFKLEGEMEYNLEQLPSKKIIKIEDKYKMYLEAPNINLNYVTLIWVDKKRRIIDIEYTYKKPYPIDIKEPIFTLRYVDKDFITSENFPEPEPEKIVLEEEKLEDITKYERITSLPIEGKFACANEPTSFLSFKYKETKLYNNEVEVIELQPYEAILSLTNQIYLVCSLRKVKGALNKYVFLFNHTFNTDYHPEAISYYSIIQPIAEIEIINDNTIKNKWLGFYNLKTKKTEGYGVYNWIDSCDNLLNKIEE